MLIIPFMSCSARLPVYVLFIGAFFPESSGSLLFIIYITGAAVAILSARLLKKSLFRSEDIPFVMELPPYRMPRLRTSVKHMWEKGVEYLKKIAGIVLVASIIIWALGAFPGEADYSKNYNAEIAKIEKQYSDIKTPEKEALIKQLNTQKESERLEQSYIGRIGHFVQPVFAQHGFDWKMSVSILTGLAAKEVVVGTLGVLYHVDEECDETSLALMKNMKEQIHSYGPDKGKKVFTKPVAFGFILFILLYFPCVGVIAAIKRESGTWKWAIFSALYTTGVAWLISFAVIKIWEMLI